MNVSHLQIKFAAIEKRPFRPHLRLVELEDRATEAVGGQPGGHP